MRVVERPQVFYFRKLFLQALTVRALFLKSRNLLQQSVTLAELFKHTCKVGPLLGSDLCRGRILRGGAVAHREGGAVCARHSKMIFERRINRVRAQLAEEGEPSYHRR